MSALSKKYKINYKRRYTIPKNKKHRAHKSIKVYHNRSKQPTRKRAHYVGGDIKVPLVYDIFPSGQSYQPNTDCLEKECDKKDAGERTTTCLNTHIVMNLFSQTLDDSENATMDRIDSNFKPAEREHVQDLTKKYLTNYVDSLFPKSFFSKNNADLTPQNATKLKELLAVINPEYVLYLTQTSTLSDDIKQKIRDTGQSALNVVVTTPLDNPIVDNPIVDNPVVDNPIVDNPIVDNPIIDNPIIDNPIIDNPIVDNPIVDNPIVDNPIVDNAIIDNPIASNTAVVDAESEADMQRQQAAEEEAETQRQQAAEKAVKKAAKKAESATKKLETDKQNAAKKLETDKQNAAKKAARDAADVKLKEELAEKKADRAAAALIKEEDREAAAKEKKKQRDAAAKTLKNTTTSKKSSGNGTRKKR